MLTQRPTTDARNNWLILFLLWAPIAVGMPIAMLMRGGPDAAQQAFWGARSMLIAGGLGVGVWQLTGRLGWPENPDPGFYAIHVVLAAVYSSLWWALTEFNGVLLGITTFNAVIARQLANPWLTWDLVFGALLYCVVVTASYMLRMREAVREERFNSLRADAELARTRLTALQAQLNPHFLFNTLHSLSSLVRHNAQLAEDALDQFGELMRYSLDNVDRESVLFEDEWKFTSDYIALETLRLGERLTVETDIDQGSLSREMPPFCIQPLVENAIRHGIGPRPEGGKLKIAAKITGGVLRIDVCDDGVGVDPADFQDCNGLGIRGVRQRLEVSGEFQGGLELVSSPGNGFRSTVTLHLDRYPKERGVMLP